MSGSHIGSNNTCADLLERSVASCRNVVSERCETAVVGGSQSIHRNVLRCFEHPVSHLLEKLRHVRLQLHQSSAGSGSPRLVGHSREPGAPAWGACVTANSG